jgi:hypothetical protein
VSKGGEKGRRVKGQMGEGEVLGREKEGKGMKRREKDEKV